jgi:uncharacterized membrane protein
LFTLGNSWSYTLPLSEIRSTVLQVIVLKYFNQIVEQVKYHFSCICVRELITDYYWFGLLDSRSYGGMSAIRKTTLIAFLITFYHKWNWTNVQYSWHVLFRDLFVCVLSSTLYFKTMLRGRSRKELLHLLYLAGA